MYDTKDEFNQKLAKSIVLYDGSPSMIQFAEGDKDIILAHIRLRKNVTEKTPAKDSGWDFRNLGCRLGYINVDYGQGSYREALYSQRMAIRQSQSAQGLSSKNVTYPCLSPQVKLGLTTYQIPWGDLSRSSFFLDTLERKYPSYDDVVKDMEKYSDITSKAFSAKFAVHRHSVGPFYLRYRDKSVGYSDDMFRWKIADDYQYLRENLDMLNLRVA